MREARLSRHAGYEVVRLDSLEPFPGNPRRGALAHIMESLARYGQYRTIVVWPAERVIVAGNHTWRGMTELAGMREGELAQRYGDEAARWAGVTDCRVEYTEFDGWDEARRVNATDNRLAELGDYDRDALAALLATFGDDWRGTGWAPEDLAALRQPEALPPGDPDDLPPVAPEPVCRPGEVWGVGPHRVLCGDAREPDLVAALMGGEHAGMLWADPPYGVEIVGGSHAVPVAKRRAQGKPVIAGDDAAGLADLLGAVWPVATSALRPGAPVYVCTGDAREQLMTAFEACASAGWEIRQTLVWVKDSLVPGNMDYHARHESMIYGFTAGGQGKLGRNGPHWYGGHASTTVFEYPRPKRSEDHPTMKPVGLVAAHIANSCPTGGIVLDTFGGSGTTLIAAHQLGRRGFACEVRPIYADLIVRRVAAYSGIDPVIVRGV